VKVLRSLAVFACAASLFAACTNDFGQFAVEPGGWGAGDGTTGDAGEETQEQDVVDSGGDSTMKEAGPADTGPDVLADTSHGDGPIDAPPDVNPDAPPTCGIPNLACCSLDAGTVGPGDAGDASTKVYEGTCSKGCCDPGTGHCVGEGIDCSQANPSICHTGSCVPCGASGGICCANQTCPNPQGGGAPPGCCDPTAMVCLDPGAACSGTDSICENGSCTGCGALGQACCPTDAGGICTAANSSCQGGTCSACGGMGLPCCPGNQCVNSQLACVGGSCTTCGGNGEPCCAGNACGSGLACSGGTCSPCGGSGEVCCAGATPCSATGACCDPKANTCVLPNADCSTSGTICIAPSGGGAGTCQVCGASGLQCCANSSCLSGGCCQASKCIAQGSACATSGDVCYGGTCQVCGHTGQPCCATGSPCLGVSPNKDCCNSGTDLCVAPGTTCSDNKMCSGTSGGC
jgi:hypothetical protein